MTWCSCLVGVMLSVAGAEEDGKTEKDKESTSVFYRADF